MQNALTSFSNIIVVRYMNCFNTNVVAGIGVAQRLDKFVGIPARLFGVMITTYISQNLGAENHDKIRKGKNKVLLLPVIVGVGFGIPIIIIAEFWVSLFNTGKEVVSAGAGMLKVLLPFIIFPAFREVYLAF